MGRQLDEFEISNEGNAPPSTTNSHETLLTSVDPEIVKAVVKPLLGISALVILLLIVSLLPGLHRIIPATPITFAALVSALFTLAIVGVLVYVAPLVEKLVQQRFGASNVLATSAAAIMKNVDFLVAVFIAHWGLAGASLPFLSDTNAAWVYDMTFLVLALIPTAHITYHVYRALDPAAELLTRKITPASEPRVDSMSNPRVDPALRTSVDSTTSDSDTAESPRSSSASILRKFREGAPTNWVVSHLRDSSTPHGGILTKKERVLQILEDHEGRIQQTSIVTITGWSKSTVSRVLSDMKEEGAIVKTNIGQGNLIALPGEEPESVKSTDREQK